jgi:hypothetical protein
MLDKVTSVTSRYRRGVLFSGAGVVFVLLKKSKPKTLGAREPDRVISPRRHTTSVANVAQPPQMRRTVLFPPQWGVVDLPVSIDATTLCYHCYLDTYHLLYRR